MIHVLKQSFKTFVKLSHPPTMFYIFLIKYMLLLILTIKYASGGGIVNENEREMGARNNYGK
jgi:hypothetical protein